MHPIVRAYAREKLGKTELSKASVILRDHFSSLPPEKPDKATQLTHLKNTIETFRILTYAGQLDQAATLYRSNLSYPLLFAMEAYWEVMEFIEPFFEFPFDGLPKIRSQSMQSYILNDLCMALKGVWKTSEAMAVQTKAIKLSLKNEEWDELLTRLANFWSCLCSINKLASATRIVELARSIADVAAIDWCHAFYNYLAMSHYALIGDFERAMKHRDIFKKYPEPPYFGVYRAGSVELVYCDMLFDQNKLTANILEQAFQMAVDGRNKGCQDSLLVLQARYRLEQGQPYEALEALSRVWQLRVVSREPSPELNAIRALALAKLNRREEAIQILNSHLDYVITWEIAAEVYFELGDRSKAREFATKAYRDSWGEGSPYVRWGVIRRCADILRRLGGREPELPPFDALKSKLIPWEEEIAQAIEKLQQKKHNSE